MLDLRTTLLTKLRSREWRLAALVLWAAVLLVNLGGGLQYAVAEPDPNICVEHVSSAPHPDQDHGTGPHCPLCFVVSAGILAPPSGTQIAVLAPATGWAELRAELSSAPTLGLPRKGPLPRAPPAFV